VTRADSGARAVTIALQTDKTAAQYAALATLVEDLGFDGLSMFADLGYQPPAGPLAVAARATSRVRLGVACQNPVLLHPVEIAGQVAMLDEMSSGRAYLGLARGAWLDGLGTPPSTMARLADAVEIIRRLLIGDDSGYQGTELGLPPGLRLRFTGHRPELDLLIGTWGRRTARWAASVGAAEIKIGGTANPDMVRRMRSWLEPATSTGVPGVVAGAVTVVDEDRDAARAAARREVAMYLDVVAQLDPTVDIDPDLLARLGALVAADDQVAAGALIDDQLLDRFAFAGAPDDVAAQAAALFEAGAARVEFGTPHGLSPAHGIELLGRRVLPALSAWRAR
jgi:5,10-methylenetetrahydromethanopterin reductase